jgi:hypothetical protein
MPIANWIPGGHAAPWYQSVVAEWLNGTTIAIGVGIVLAILSRRFGLLWRDDAPLIGKMLWERRPNLMSSMVATAALLTYAVVALGVFSGRPLLIDEIAQVIHARILADGALYRPTFAYPEFFSSMHVLDMHGRYFSQFPAGGPAMLTLGVLVGAPWIVGPVCGAAAVLAFSAYARGTGERPGTAFLATLIFAFAPFAVFMSGSHMNHVTVLMWVLIAITAMARVITADHASPLMAALCGFGFGMAATIRPVDAFAFALPAGVWLLWRALRAPRRWADAVLAGLGVALPVLALMWVNLRTTGSPLLFGYEALWGKSHSLGFHTAPWGVSHTPARGLELVNLYFLRLQTYFLETPIPSLLPAIAALALTRRLNPFDRYLLTASALLVGLYFAYWHDGFYLGPRFMYPLLVPLAIWTARFFPLARERLGSGLAYRTTIYGAVCASAISAAVDVPLRVRQYRGGLQTMRWDADSAAATAGVKDALILVRESWGAQLVARMWALGIPRSETELLYRRVDACALDHAITTLEESTVRDTAAFLALQPMLRDSTRVVAMHFSADTTARYLPGQPYTARCQQRIAEDREGFTLLTPLLLARAHGNIYARHLGERDTLLLRVYPDRPVYLLRPATDAEGEPPRFYPLSRDSLERVWRRARAQEVMNQSD